MKPSLAVPYYFNITVKHCALACLLFAFRAAEGQACCAKTAMMEYLVL